MLQNKPIVVYEHSRLFIGEQGFEEKHFTALVKFNDRHRGKYFRVGHRKITFKSYVGVIQAGNLIIEILPKADASNGVENDTRWRNALLQMLKVAGHVKLNETDQAQQQLQNACLLDVYLSLFLKEVDVLLHAGLTRQYRQTTGNRLALNGRLLNEKQILLNTVHKERFYTEHIVYDNDHLLNRILKIALTIVRDTSLSSTIRQSTAKSLLSFDDVSSQIVGEEELRKIVYNRKTDAYKPAIDLAKMIILHHRPKARGGDLHTLALLFDMNMLFEKFIFNSLKRQQDDFGPLALKITGKNSQVFWEHKSIRPDILLTYAKKGGNEVENIVIDTKWKLVDQGYPSDADLKQMFAYNIQYKSNRAILLYPFAGQENLGEKQYAKGLREPSIEHACEMYFIDLFDVHGIVNNSFAGWFLTYLLGNPELVNPSSD